MKISDLLIEETKMRLIEESLPRVEKCLNFLTEEQIWYQHNANTNSIGNLVLHLCGNIRQWIVSGLGKNEDIRQRNKEFLQKSRVDKNELLRRFRIVMKDVEKVLQTLDPKMLTEIHDVQVYQQSGVSILVHVVEHCSYHVGQITYLTKYLLDLDTKYYTEDLG